MYDAIALGDAAGSNEHSIERDLRQLAWHGLRTAEFDVPAAPIDVHVHQVTHIELPRNGLNGPFPAAFGVAVPRLEVLDLAGNGLAGLLPPGLGNCTALRELRLGDNCLMGGLPSAWSSLLHSACPSVLW